MYLSSGLSFCRMRMTYCTMDGYCLLYLLMILLIRSGDVETNPGPDRIVSEKEFLKLSKQIEPSYYITVGINLDISRAELGQIKERSQNTSDALMTVFTRWRDKQPPGTDIRALLAEGLEISDLGSLSGSLVSKRTDKTTSIPSVPNASASTTTPTTDAAAAAAATTTTQKDLLPSTKDFDDILVTVAKRVRKESEIDTLGKKLKFSPEDVHGYIATNHKTQHVTYDGTLLMLRDWRNRQTISTERGALNTALVQSEQIRLADDLFPSNV